MTDIIKINAERNRRERPDPDCIRRDGFGREMYLFAVEYAFADGEWAFDLWAYSMEDAAARVAAIREGVLLRGQVHGKVLA